MEIIIKMGIITGVRINEGNSLINEHAVIIFLKKWGDKREEDDRKYAVCLGSFLSGGLHGLVQHHFSYFFERALPKFD